jgi:anti-anti-sigma regulatory factor/HAMP domain-containing protein
MTLIELKYYNTLMQMLQTGKWRRTVIILMHFCAHHFPLALLSYRAIVAEKDAVMYRTIRFRLFVTLALNVTLLIALGGSAVVLIGRVQEQAHIIDQDTIPSVELLDQVDNTIIEYRALQLRHILNRGTIQVADVEAGMQTLEQQMGTYFVQYQPLISDDQEQIAFSRLQTGWTSLILFTHQKLLPLDRAGKSDQALDVFDESKLAYDDLTRSARDLVRINHEQSAQATQKVEQASRAATSVLLALTLAVIGLASALGVIQSRAIVRGIGALAAGTAAVAGGDLNHRVVVPGTDELSRLATAFNSMTDDLLAQRTVVEQRSEQLRQSLEAQHQLFVTVQQLSTPILPVADGVIVLPLVGHIDTQRAQHITEALLQGVAAEHARVAILDITGVAAADTQVLGLLLGAIRGVELLGARALLAGTSADLAQQIATQGFDFGELRSYHDLRDAMRAAQAAFSQSIGVAPAGARSVR